MLSLGLFIMFSIALLVSNNFSMATYCLDNRYVFIGLVLCCIDVELGWIVLLTLLLKVIAFTFSCSWVYAQDVDNFEDP
jgi:hypothetical protein